MMFGRCWDEVMANNSDIVNTAAMGHNHHWTLPTAFGVGVSTRGFFTARVAK